MESEKKDYISNQETTAVYYKKPNQKMIDRYLQIYEKAKENKNIKACYLGLDKQFRIIRKENYNHAGTRKIPFYKMDEAELVEALTPEESGKLERVTFWEFNDIRKHPGVKETVCIEESYIYSFKFKCGREESIKICPVEDITLPPMTGEEIMEYNGGGMSWGNYDRVVHSDDVKEVKKLLTKKLDFCEKWQQERYRKYEAILKDGRVSTFTVND